MGLVVLGAAACGSPSESSITPPGEILGRVEVSTGIPASSCLVLVEGAPISAKCDENGAFDLRNMPPGRWDLRIQLDDGLATLPARRIAAGANSNFVSDLGAIELSQPGSVGGHVTGDAATLAVSYIAVPSIGAVTAPNAGGGYLLDNVSPGTHDIILITPAGAIDQAPVNVNPKVTTIGVNFDLGAAAMPGVNVHGIAGRSDGSSDGMTVELVGALDGNVVQTVQPGDAGTFNFPATPAGAYIVRASDGSNPAKAIIPSIVVGTSDIELGSSLIVPSGHDLDGDGIPDELDDDIDGDGVANDADAFPYDPAETVDSDGDGVGDRADLRSKGGGNVDHDVPTPDTDGDGLLDFEDNCPHIPNKNQGDADRDGVGDACDTCPTLPNPDQTGLCVQCLSNAQCGNDVCEGGLCVACTQTSQCTTGETCNTALGVCVTCVTDPDCGDPTKACILGVCTAKCTDDTTCPGAHCDPAEGVCVQCRGTADCPMNEYCDQNACSAKCTSSGQCSGNRACDLPTGTCVTPCNGTCAAGDKCVADVCRAACDASVPCPSGLECDAATGACKPECVANMDCAAAFPHTLCSFGACVPDGTCSFDADCPSSDLCVSGTCKTRTTPFDPGQGFECTGACDCRQGEVCDVTGGHCVNDAVAFGDGTNRQMTPTFFAQTGGTGSGASPDVPGDPAAALAAVAAGTTKIVALRAGDTISLSTPVAFETGDVAVLGGFAVCAPNRWVRDLTQSTTIASSVTTGFSIPGTSALPMPHVALESLALTSTDSNQTHRRFMIDAFYAPALVVSHVSMSQTLPVPASGGQSVGGVSCDHCTGVGMDHLTIIGSGSANANASFGGVEVTSGSGTFDQIHVGAIVEARDIQAIYVSNTTGPVTITNAVIDPSQSGDGAGIQVASCGIDPMTSTSFPVVVASSTVGFNGRSTAIDQTWYGIAISGCQTANVHDDVIDGNGVTFNSGALHIGVGFTDASGAITNVHVVLPTNTAGGQTTGYSVTGPHGAVAMSGDTTAGGSTPNLDLVDVVGVTQGVVAISGGTFANGAAVNANGLFMSGSSNGSAPAVTVIDTSFAIRGTGGGTGNAIQLGGSSARIERTRATTSAFSTGSATTLATASTLELYDSFLFTDPALNSNGTALAINPGCTVLAVGDTIDGGGSPSTANTTGIACTGGSLTLRSSLVGGGGGSNHLMLGNPGSGDTSCWVPSHFDHDYFWYARQGAPQTSGEAALIVDTAAVGTKDGTGNEINNTVGCYDGAFPQPDFHLAAGSPCTDFGVAGTRLDGSPISKDITNSARVKGAAADVGAFEKE